MFYRNFYKDLSENAPCPAMAVIWAIDAIAHHLYLANRHHLKAPRDVVVVNLKTTLFKEMDDFGPLYILDKFESHFYPERK